MLDGVTRRIGLAVGKGPPFVYLPSWVPTASMYENMNPENKVIFLTCVPNADLIDTLIVVIKQTGCYQVGIERLELLQEDQRMKLINTKFWWKKENLRVKPSMLAVQSGYSINVTEEAANGVQYNASVLNLQQHMRRPKVASQTLPRPTLHNNKKLLLYKCMCHRAPTTGDR